MTTIVCAERLMGLRVGRGDAACVGGDDGTTAGVLGAARLARAVAPGGWVMDPSTSGTTLAGAPRLA
jgi:hypothetical protein